MSAVLFDHTDGQDRQRLPGLCQSSNFSESNFSEFQHTHLKAPGAMEYWSDGSEPSTRFAPTLQYSNLNLLPEHFPKLLAPALQLFATGQSHDDDLIVLHVLFELVIGLRVKNILAEAAENSLRFGADEEIGEQARRVGVGRL